MTGALFGTAPTDDLDEDCRVLGIDPTTLPQRPDEEDGVWPCHVEAVRAFLSISRQWRVVSEGMGGLRWIGLDYTAAKAGLDLAGITVMPEVWSQVRVIEAGALEALNGSS